ncbi:MAG TPA: hypothetical protein ENI95_04370, partial [Chloroflexi bacterium]|nr:hypothetical protein [Chloroflexota bacterium]
MVSDRTASTRQIAANILLALLIFAFIWGCVAASLLVFPLLEGGGMSLPEMASTLGITTVILCPLVFLSGGMLLGLRALAQKRVSGHLDPMFEALGFSGMPSGLGITGRRIYHGVVGGRRVNVRYARTYRSRGGTRAATYRGSTVTVVVEAPSLATRMGIGLRTALSNALNRFIKREEIPLDDPGYEDLIAYALDEDWTRALLSHEEGRELIRSLMADP